MILLTLFYLFGIIFFIIIIVAAFIFIRKTTLTANQIKKILSSSLIDLMIQQLRNAVTTSARHLNL